MLQSQGNDYESRIKKTTKVNLQKIYPIYKDTMV